MWCDFFLDDTVLANLRFYFNKTCYAGVLLDPARVSQLPIKSHEEKPAQALKELIQKLMDISTDQLKFIDLLEFAFGSRIYDRVSAKILKKVCLIFNNIRESIWNKTEGVYNTC